MVVLDTKKRGARWLSHLLTPEQKQNGMDMCCVIADVFRDKADKSLRRYVTVDEMWIQYYTPGTQQQSKRWKATGEVTPVNVRLVASTGKVLSFVLDMHDIIYDTSATYRTEGQ